MFRAFTYLCLFLGTVFVLTGYLFHLDKLYIRQVYISGNKQVLSSQIFSVTKGVLGGRYYGLYPKNNLLIYPKKLIKESLLRSIPWIASVGVFSDINSLFIEVEERVPKYLWCDDLSEPILDRTCYYLDMNGLAFDKAPSFSSHVYLEFYGGNKRGGYIGKSILSPDTLRIVLEMKDSMEKTLKDKYPFLVRIYGVYVYNNDDYEFLFTQGRKESKIIFNLPKNASEDEKMRVDKKFKAIMTSPFFMKELNNTNRQLKYIDLRFGKKVFYKFD